jgi:hypothetical protein
MVEAASQRSGSPAPTRPATRRNPGPRRRQHPDTDQAYARTSVRDPVYSMASPSPHPVDARTRDAGTVRARFASGSRSLNVSFMHPDCRWLDLSQTSPRQWCQCGRDFGRNPSSRPLLLSPTLIRAFPLVSEPRLGEAFCSCYQDNLMSSAKRYKPERRALTPSAWRRLSILPGVAAERAIRLFGLAADEDPELGLIAR